MPVRQLRHWSGEEDAGRLATCNMAEALSLSLSLFPSTCRHVALTARTSFQGRSHSAGKSLREAPPDGAKLRRPRNTWCDGNRAILGEGEAIVSLVAIDIP